MSVQKKQQAYARGVEAEQVAARYLKARGYKILEQRYKTPVGEVDLIAQKDGGLVFAEVKAHKNEEAALYAVTEQSRRRIEAAAGHYLSRHEDMATCGMRFDVLVVPPEALKERLNLLGAVSVRHLDNAWVCGE